MTIRLLLVDDQLTVRRVLRLRLEMEPDIEVVGEAANGVDAVAFATRLYPDVVVMDVAMPVMDGIEATHKLRTVVPKSSVVILSLYDDATTHSRARKAGAAAFVAKHQADGLLLNAIREAAAHGSQVINGSQGGQGP
jgi:DNA-binding NarL/FixJ family response regulator